ncbi:DUF5125 domain-containing protein [Sphingobacterium siyangense]|jgi:hypothetical protein|uniref:DUF5125 domain-containing protein n=1 Tax=Sphingobacterium siyangense TaxID=459529 RepID=UPI0028A93DE0|nr:DUF5125 domain-containing protein [Sphingobacterium siyangense]
MRRKTKLFLLLGMSSAVYACKEDIQIDTPSIASYQTVEVAYMGDSIPVDITVDGAYPLNTIKTTFFRNDERIAEGIIPANKAAIYHSKLLVPFIKDIADGPAEIQIMVKNKNFNYTTIMVPIQITRPKFPYLTLKTAYGDYKMEPVPGEPYKYAVTEAFPNTKLNALIEAPPYGKNGNSFLFGGATISAHATNKDSIPFQIVRAPGSTFTVSFDTRSFEAAPFLKPSFGGIEFPNFANNIAVIEAEFKQNQLIGLDGIVDIANWWINPSFLSNNGDGTYKFRAIDGKYRITADQALKYFKIEPMAGDALANFDPVRKTGGVWVNGGIGDSDGSAPKERFGIPSMAANPSLWNPQKNVAMAPLGNGVYQIKLIAGQNLFLSNVSGSTVGISFYQNSRSFDNYFALNLVQNLYGSPGQPTSAGGTTRFELKTSIGNVSKDAPIISTVSNRTLGANRTYVFTLDTKVSPAAVTITLE